MTAKISTFTGTQFMCSPPPVGFGIRFSVAEDKSIYATVVFDKSKEGGAGILHGGAIAAVLDEAMGVAAYESGQAGYTVTMTYNYKTHIPLNQPIIIRAWVEKIEGRKVFAMCAATLKNNTVAVDGHGIFVASNTLQNQLESNPYYPEDEL